MGKRFDEKIKLIEDQIEGIKKMFSSGPVDYKDYRMARKKLNAPIIELVYGATINDAKISFNKSLLSLEELAKLHDILKDLTENIETPFINGCNAALAADVSNNNMPIIPGATLPQFDKAKKKTVVDGLIGGGPNSLVKSMFTADQLLDMAASAEVVRKRIRRNQILIIGGIALTVTAVAVGCGVAYHCSKKKKLDETNDMVEDPNGIDDPDSIDDAEEVPHVDLSEV